MSFNLVDGWLNLCLFPKVLDLLFGEIRDSDGSYFALLYQCFHGLPSVNNGHVDDIDSFCRGIDRKALSIVGAPEGHWPVNLGVLH